MNFTGNMSDATEEDRGVSYKRSWTPKEDQAILRLVQEHGASNWGSVASFLVARTGKQCRERYHNHLQPDVKKGDWTASEDNLIIELQKKYGNQWAKITKELPGRTDNAVKNRWHAAMRARQKIVESQQQQAKPKTVVPKLALGCAMSSNSTFSSSSGACGTTSETDLSMEEIVRKYSPRFVRDMTLSDSVDLNQLSHGHHMHSHYPITARSDCTDMDRDMSWVPTPREEVETAATNASLLASSPSNALSVFLHASSCSPSGAVTLSGVTASDLSELAGLMETVRNLSPRPAAVLSGSESVVSSAVASENCLLNWSRLRTNADSFSYTYAATEEVDVEEEDFDFCCVVADSDSDSDCSNHDMEGFSWGSPRGLQSPRVSHMSPRARMQQQQQQQQQQQSSQRITIINKAAHRTGRDSSKKCSKRSRSDDNLTGGRRKKSNRETTSCTVAEDWIDSYGAALLDVNMDMIGMDTNMNVYSSGTSIGGGDVYDDSCF